MSFDRIGSTNPAFQSEGIDNKKAVESLGKTADNRQVNSVVANKQIPDAPSLTEKTETSLAERTISNDSNIATADDFEAAITEMKYFSEIQDQIEKNPDLNTQDVKKGPSELGPATKAVASVFSALQSIKHASDEKLIAYNYMVHSRNMTLPEGATPYGARNHLENAFESIKKMQSMDNKLSEFSPADIALSMTNQRDRPIVRPHIEAMFADLENKGPKA